MKTLIVKSQTRQRLPRALMIKYGEPNPLNVLGLRRLDHNPPHFTRVAFDLRVDPKTICDWIYENLEGRFWFGDYYQLSEDGKVGFCKAVSFEHAAEASYFGLVLNQINSVNTDFSV
jgi:hypothetical protein